jgi:hypothetical protein
MAFLLSEYLGIRELYPLHDPGEPNSFSLDEKMNVVGHQNVGTNSKALPPTIMFNAIEVAQPIPVAAEDLLALIATHNDVTKGPSNSTRGLPAMIVTLYTNLKVQTHA